MSRSTAQRPRSTSFRAQDELADVVLVLEAGALVEAAARGARPQDQELEVSLLRPAEGGLQYLGPDALPAAGGVGVDVRDIAPGVAGAGGSRELRDDLDEQVRHDAPVDLRHPADPAPARQALAQEKPALLEERGPLDDGRRGV